MARAVALLRGINLGPSRRMPMAELRHALEAAGYEDVATLVQSGNVVLSSDKAPAELERELADLLEESFGFEVGVVVRTRKELAAVIKADPFGKDASDPKLFQVSFLSAEPAADAADAVAAKAAGKESVVFKGREVYAWHPNGIARSKLAKEINAKRLGVEVTARNWRTVTKLLEMLDV